MKKAMLEALQAVIRSRHFSIDHEHNRTNEAINLRRMIIAAIEKSTEIMSIEEIASVLRDQARMRGPENDEAGILSDLADALETQCAQLDEADLIEALKPRR